MCFSATASYSAAAVLVTTGLYAIQQARRLPPPYWIWALVPVLFGIQQAFEGRVWQNIDAGNANDALPFALGFHFFSHFLWLWWLPLCSYLVEPRKSGKIRKNIFLGCAIFGAFAGALTYSVILSHPEWMKIAVREHSIIYDFIVPENISIPYVNTINIPVTPVMLYGLTILVPLLSSSHRQIRIFGGLVVLSLALASLVYDKAFVSVWCFFAAVISLYIVYMIRHLATEGKLTHNTPVRQT